MDNMDVKKKVLEEIMSLMDEKEGDNLKCHPKLMAAKMAAAKPEVVALEPELKDEDPLLAGGGEEELDEDMISQLLEKYQSMK